MPAPAARRPQYPAVRVIVALAIILPYEIATDFHATTLGIFLVAMAGFGAGHLVELLIARSRTKAPSDAPPGAPPER